MATLVSLPPLGGRHVDHPRLALACAVLAVVFTVVFTSLAMRANSQAARAVARRGADRPRWTRGMTVALLGAILSYGAVLAL
jgi:hypothetical protein